MRSYRFILITVIGMGVIILIGTIGFQYYEKINFLDSLWMTVITILTVGYGDIVPHTVEGKLFAILILPFGIGLSFYAIGGISAGLIEGELSKTVGRKRMEQKIKKMNRHIIICGLGRVGQQVALNLLQEKKPLVVIEENHDLVENFSHPILYIDGDATEEKVLIKAGIAEASGVIAALPNDADNVLITLTAKGLNPNIQVVARAEKTESIEKLRRAGADKVINPSSIGGRRMAMSILKPTSIEYIDTILHGKNGEIAIEEMMIKQYSKLAGKSLRETQIREKHGITIIAIKRENEIISNPKADEILRLNDYIFVIGTKEQFKQFERDMNN